MSDEPRDSWGFYSHWRTTPHMFRPIKLHSGGEGSCRLCGCDGGAPHVEDEVVVIASMQAEIDELRGRSDRTNRLVNALTWTERNFRLAVNNKPVRDMAENLAFNAAVLSEEGP